MTSLKRKYSNSLHRVKEQKRKGPYLVAPWVHLKRGERGNRPPPPGRKKKGKTPPLLERWKKKKGKKKKKGEKKAPSILPLRGGRPGSPYTSVVENAGKKKKGRKKKKKDRPSFEKRPPWAGLSPIKKGEVKFPL